jgi:hypothetical protein
MKQRFWVFSLSVCLSVGMYVCTMYVPLTRVRMIERILFIFSIISFSNTGRSLGNMNILAPKIGALQIVSRNKMGIFFKMGVTNFY